MPQAVSDREEARVGARLKEPRSQDGEGKRRVLADAGQERRGTEEARIWGRGGDRPDAGEKSGKNAAEDRRPAPGDEKRSRGVKRRASGRRKTATW